MIKKRINMKTFEFVENLKKSEEHTEINMRNNLQPTKLKMKKKMLSSYLG